VVVMPTTGQLKTIPGTIENPDEGYRSRLDKKNEHAEPGYYSVFLNDYRGTAVAIEAGLLSKNQIKTSLEKMVANVKESGAGSIGLTMYPPYPEGFFENEGMYPYGYQNGGDWTWFGGRMIQQLITNGSLEEACEHIQPMVKRVKDNNGFF
jgi:hypothetical protein